MAVLGLACRYIALLGSIVLVNMLMGAIVLGNIHDGVSRFLLFRPDVLSRFLLSRRGMNGRSQPCPMHI